MDFLRLRRLAPLVAALFVSACVNLSGLGSNSEFQCKAPEGVPCQSVSGVHHNERAGNLPSQRLHKAVPAAPVVNSPETVNATPDGTFPGPGEAQKAPPKLPAYRKAVAPPEIGAIRSEPTIVRVWIAPWEDADGDLHDQSYVYLQVDAGRWLIEHNRAQIRREFAPAKAGAALVGEAVPSSPKPAAASPAPAARTGPQAMEEAMRQGRAQAAAAAERDAAAKAGARGEVRP
ncbi:Type IV conjugative transfer system protein TraV [Rubrivivax sp. A210]|uniref:type IV conjugative transfer system lipoprotein TraV n=1 Tax=Rubrivivax sp. A210 TaxID=2772301 RepID=UPI001917FDE2|nr:type IV conjugative transfer system lipoprotein TraV [Rubrivivax sp. A210]CAD5366869.1 Type IV conjugative transfer system protein TraV [Rubrivivax sp. A210]